MNSPRHSSNSQICNNHVLVTARWLRQARHREQASAEPRRDAVKALRRQIAAMVAVAALLVSRSFSVVPIAHSKRRHGHDAHILVTPRRSNCQLQQAHSTALDRPASPCCRDATPHASKAATLSETASSKPVQSRGNACAYICPHDDPMHHQSRRAIEPGRPMPSPILTRSRACESRDIAGTPCHQQRTRERTCSSLSNSRNHRWKGILQIGKPLESAMLRMMSGASGIVAKQVSAGSCSCSCSRECDSRHTFSELSSLLVTNIVDCAPFDASSALSASIPADQTRCEPNSEECKTETAVVSRQCEAECRIGDVNA